jgi:recombination protein RecR
MSDNHYPKPLVELISSISRLPGIGKRTAERLALSLHEWPSNELEFLGKQITDLKENVISCQQCGNFADSELCRICLNDSRDQTFICIVETAAQIPVIEKSGSFKGLYHVLNGRLSPVNGHGPERLNLEPLLRRLGKIQEVILATSPDFDGEATASFIANLLKDKNISITRIARGIPVGADISYADAASMAMAITSRRDMGV